MNDVMQHNPFNPQNIQAGDKVRLHLDDADGTVYTVKSVGGRHNNKVFVPEIGRELFAQCFDKIEA